MNQESTMTVPISEVVLGNPAGSPGSREHRRLPMAEVEAAVDPP